MLRIFLILIQPARFFKNLEKSNPSWVIALPGYYIMGFVLSAGRYYFEEETFALGTILLKALPAAMLLLVIFGLFWAHLGSVLFQGSATMGVTLKAVGYVCFAVGVLGLLYVPIMFYLPFGEAGGMIRAVMRGYYIVLRIWCLVGIAIAVKEINGFLWLQTIGVLGWLLAMFLGLVLLFYHFAR